jgi:hypothetical protein
MTKEVDRIAAIRDPFELLRQATDRLADAQNEVTGLARLRRRVVKELQEQGMSYAQIAEAAGLSRGRIHQIRHGGPPVEGAFLGDGTVVIATPLKREAIKARPVVAVEDVAGSQRLAELARAFGLNPSFETVPLGGSIDLNRPNLIVICGPRLSAPVAQVLAQDPRLHFVRAEDGPWTLHDVSTGKTYRSGQDEQPERPWDVAYFGRLPRPDGRGNVIIFTGIHPQGSLGVVQLLTTQIEALYAEVKEECFSALVGTDYDPDTHEPQRVELLTPLYLIDRTDHDAHSSHK